MLCLSWSFLDVGLRHCGECSFCVDQQALVFEGVECNVVFSSNKHFDDCSLLRNQS